MKYSYFCNRKSGKYTIRTIFLDNNKTHCLMCTGNPPAYAVMMTPDYKWDWYWENLDGELVHDSYQDVIPTEQQKWGTPHGYHNETWYYKETRGQYSIKKYLKPDDFIAAKYPAGDFQKCFNHAFEQDIIVNPLVMLGYHGVVGKGNLGKRLRERQPRCQVNTDFVVAELCKRKNYITTKSDIKKLAYNMFAGTGRPPYFNTTEYVSKIRTAIDDNIQFEKDIAGLLDYYGIPYEWFDLDKDDYSKFGVRYVPDDRYITTKIFENYPTSRSKVDKWVQDYLYG